MMRIGGPGLLTGGMAAAQPLPVIGPAVALQVAAFAVNGIELRNTATHVHW